MKCCKCKNEVTKADIDNQTLFYCDKCGYVESAMGRCFYKPLGVW